VTRPFEKVSVIGLGLLGGSVAAAARRAGVAEVVSGASRSQEACEYALAHEWLDEVGSAVEVARGADLVILATPVFAMADVVREIAPVLRRDALVSDVGSVKAGLVESLPGLLPAGASYIGSHPMAGSHERGIASASPDLFEGAACIVTEGPTPGRERIAEFWKALGARVVLRDAAAHDEQVAWTSHVPHALAFAFAASLEAAPPGCEDVAGSGFRDFTRIAQSEPELWGDILTANRKALAAPLAEVARTLEALGRAIESDDSEAVEQWIARARDALARQHDQRQDR
jgi:cyclohexadieny/prephenate dehydrogenase